MTTAADRRSRRRTRPHRPMMREVGRGTNALVLLIALQCLVVRRASHDNERGDVHSLMVQSFAATTTTTIAACRKSSRTDAHIIVGSSLGNAVRGGGGGGTDDEGIGEMMEKTTIIDEVGCGKGGKEEEDIGKVHNAKYINGLIETLESVLDKWIVSGAMATVSNHELDHISLLFARVLYCVLIDHRDALAFTYHIINIMPRRFDVLFFGIINTRGDVRTTSYNR